jgi:hypothetical protein
MSLHHWKQFLRLAILITVQAGGVSGLAQEQAIPGQPGSAAISPNSAAQSSGHASSAATTESIRELQEQVRELQAMVVSIRADWREARSETAELRRELGQVRAGQRQPDSGDERAAARTYGAIEETNRQNKSVTDVPSGGLRDSNKQTERAASLDEEYQLLTGKVDEQYQTKVESASKYRLRISGIVLMNLFSNQGVVDNIDIPSIAYARPSGSSGGSFGATLRQSQIGFEAFGPMVAGAKTRADLQLDLGGGFPSVPNGVNSGIVRLRTGTMRMDWKDTSLVVGQDAIFFSPNSPTSFASLAIPALSAAGNLWSWVPQIRVEHKINFADDSSLMLQAGILDPISGEAPPEDYYRQPGPGEASRQPAYGTRIAWTRSFFGQPVRVGVGGFYSRQNYNFSRTLDAWAGMADFELPLNRQFSLDGKLYRGKGLGGLYAAFGQSAVFSGDPALADTEVRGLNTVGGWAQLKYRPANKWEFNAAFGMDNPYASDLEYFPYSQNYGGGTVSLSRSKGSFANFIYRPRSDLLFSAEYRRLATYTLSGGGNEAGQLNLMMGVLF